MDQDIERAMLSCIHEEFAGYTILMVSHRMETIMEFDRVAVIDEGRVVESGRPQEFDGHEVFKI